MKGILRSSSIFQQAAASILEERVFSFHLAACLDVIQFSVDLV